MKTNNDNSTRITNKETAYYLQKILNDKNEGLTPRTKLALKNAMDIITNTPDKTDEDSAIVEPIYVFKNGDIIGYGNGRIGSDCVFLNDEGWTAWQCLDKMGTVLQEFPGFNKKMYDDFVKIYDKTTDEVNYDVFYDINKIAYEYGITYGNIMVRVFSVMYLAMISDMKGKYHSKKARRLNVYRYLIEGIPSKQAVYGLTRKHNVTREVIEEMARERGF